ncbi:hypothetical protein TRIUR3_31867 [Triticum urartu]|uniref:Uncharacterized protein n=1 Tax=Triticum urartu TaxID=4572 RepID=M7ZLI4_TRIUA|nr:hypothetical protein TRIUR3_31867 [Triticum urartu]
MTVAAELLHGLLRFQEIEKDRRKGEEEGQGCGGLDGHMHDDSVNTLGSWSFHPPGNDSSSTPASTSCKIHIGSSWFEPYNPVDRPSGAESEALDRETPLRVCLDSDAPPEIEYYDLSHEFDVKMLHPVRDDELQVFSARFNKVFGKCQGLGNVCFLHGILTRNGRLCVAMRFSEGSIRDRMVQLKGGRLPLSNVLRCGVGDQQNGKHASEPRARWLVQYEEDHPDKGRDLDDSSIKKFLILHFYALLVRKEERRDGLHDNILNGLELAGIIDRRYVNVDT